MSDKPKSGRASKSSDDTVADESPDGAQAASHIDEHPEVGAPDAPPQARPEPLSAAATIAPPVEPWDPQSGEPKPLTDAEQAAQDHHNAEMAAAVQAEKDKAYRAENGLTGSANGDPAGIAFGPRIAAAQFEHRNQGHDDTMQLLDDMLAAIQRLEAKAAEGAKPADA